MAQPETLSRRERQMMDVIYRKGEASAAEVRAEIADPPSYSAVRATLRILEEKGMLCHEEREGKYVFRPVAPRNRARQSALRHLLDTFFEGSAPSAVAALLGSASKFSREELDQLSGLIERAKKERTS